MLTCLFVDRVVLQLSLKEVISYPRCRESSACVIEAYVEDDVGNCVGSVDHRDVVDGFRCGEAQETDDFCVGL